MTIIPTHAAAQRAPGYRNPVHAAEHAYLEALSAHGFGSPECAAAFVALRRARQAGRDLACMWAEPPQDRAA